MFLAATNGGCIYLIDDSSSVAIPAGGLPEHVVEAGLVRVILRAGVPLLHELDGLLSRLGRVVTQHAIHHLTMMMMPMTSHKGRCMDEGVHARETGASSLVPGMQFAAYCENKLECYPA